MSEPVECQKCGANTYSRDGYKCPECNSPEKRAEQAEQDLDATRVKLGFTRTALRKAAETFHDFATTLRLLNHHLAADAAALAEKHTRAALEDSE